MSETMDNTPTGGSNYRCARGGAGCGAVLGGPADQDQHNQDAHSSSGWNRPGENPGKMTRDEAILANQESGERMRGGDVIRADKQAARAPVETTSEGNWPK
jgi:hypothetical protein